MAGRAVIQDEDPTALAITGAQRGQLGAGDALWLQDETRVKLAIVLEPDDPLTKAAQMLPLGIAAAGDCLATLTPPQVAVNYRWPATLLLNGADTGHCSLIAPAALGAEPAAVPPWMVLSLNLLFAFDDRSEPGTSPGITALTEEGIADLTTIDVIESFTRHFLSQLDTWTNDGFSEVVSNWAGRLESVREAQMIAYPGGALEGQPLGLDEDGNLLVRPATGGDTIALSLIDYIELASP